MQYLIDISMDTEQKRTYRVDAEDETQAIERLKLRLPPSQRDSVTIDGIKIDPASVAKIEPYGIFGEE